MNTIQMPAESVKVTIEPVQPKLLATPPQIDIDPPTIALRAVGRKRQPCILTTIFFNALEVPSIAKETIGDPVSVTSIAVFGYAIPNMPVELGTVDDVRQLVWATEKEVVPLDEENIALLVNEYLPKKATPELLMTFGAGWGIDYSTPAAARPREVHLTFNAKNGTPTVDTKQLGREFAPAQPAEDNRRPFLVIDWAILPGLKSLMTHAIQSKHPAFETFIKNMRTSDNTTTQATGKLAAADLESQLDKRLAEEEDLATAGEKDKVIAVR